jgi:hypothetical protein
MDGAPDHQHVSEASHGTPAAWLGGLSDSLLIFVSDRQYLLFRLGLVFCCVMRPRTL